MMDEKDAPRDSCVMRETDNRGHPNLCCCYIVDVDGKFHDPCFYPPDGCCPHGGDHPT
jgi:hypothetical protein